MTFTYSDELFSDIHKDAYGFRPKSEAWARWNSLSPERKQEEWNYMQSKINFDCEWEARQQEEARKAFASRVNSLIQSGAGNAITALRWIAESHGYKALDFMAIDFLEYEYNLGYGKLYTMYNLEEVMKGE